MKGGISRCAATTGNFVQEETDVASSSTSLQVNLPEPGVSFAFIYSVEDPKENSQNTGIAAQVACLATRYLLALLLGDQSCILPVPAVSRCAALKCCHDKPTAMQVMGPDDSYLLQYSRNTRPFWASQDELLLGACFRAPAGQQDTSLAERLAQDPAQIQVRDSLMHLGCAPGRGTPELHRRLR